MSEEKKSIASLEFYIEQDPYFNGIYKIESDFDKYCFEHCQDIKTVLTLLKKQQKEIEYWKEQAEGYEGLTKQIQEDYENRLEEYYNEG